ncbi:hypothetical protein PAECIP111891_03991 [Paenibacillus allorhizoplanae]|uniref:SLH domain-containing protein n=1 Tax=Paenibacillus allorhizoplanae TaxID=2905648 RepID=A0ABM9CIY8_9BACL|nr:S8 family serine peptidase [Paenibacillus allorhizoplanae]CAH1213567.1 hypothetical protein PAECIP111891_03991 [Paenibacillus allorhizoplanae]
MVLHKRKLLLALVSLFTVFNLSLGTVGFAQEPNELAATSTAPSWNESDIVPGKVLVKYKQQPAANGILASSAHAVSSWTTLNFNSDLSVSDKLNELQKDPNVEYAEPVYKVHLIATDDSTRTASVTNTVYIGDDSYMQHWGQIAAHVDDLGNFSDPNKNKEVTVAVLDTGVDMYHPDLQSALVIGRNFINTQITPQDDNGHGTHVSGIIAAQSQGNLQIGVASGVKIMPLKVLDNKGKGDSSLLIDAIQYAIDNHVDLINMSLGLSGDSKALHEIIKKAHAQHIVLVSAAGNESNHWINTEPGQWDLPTDSDTIRYARYTNYPAAYEEVISVGAIAQLPDKSYAIADFSNVGKVDVVAPGVNIYSTAMGGNYMYMSGTSQATPFITGLSALLKAANKDLDEEDIRNILQTSASKYQSSLLSLKLNGSINKSIPYTIFTSAHVSYSAAYGDGLIDGIRAFQIPRLKLTPAPGGENYPTNPNVIYDLSLLDIHNNTVVTATYNVALEARAYNETSYDRVGDESYYLGALSSGQLQDGKARLTAAFNTNNPVHHINIHGLWSEPVPGGTYYHHHSNSYTFLGLPSKPIVNLSSGTYVGEQNVTIASPYQEGSIYVELTTKDESKYAYFNYSGVSLKISTNTQLTVATLHHNVFSEDAIYQYTITAPRVGGGGGGGGGGSSQQPPSLNADGKMAYEFKPAHVDLLILLNKALADLTLDARTKENVDILSIEMDADIVQKASQMNRPIVIEANDINMQVPPNAWPIKLSTGKILFTSSKTNTSIPNFTSASAIYDFSVTEDGSKINSFASPVKVTIPFDAKKVKDVHKLSVYFYDEDQGAWTPIAGTLNSDGTMTASLAHFSKYAVLEKQNDTILKDIKDHWAQKEIENLAGKGIIDGIDQDSFQPDTTLTRAQFVTIIAKALKLQEGSKTDIFQDVSADAWYRNSVYAAYSAGIISGMSEQTFVPDAPITREQMALTMVNAYLHATGKKLEDIVTTQEVKYADEGTISTWARSYVRIASALGLLSGTTGGQFAPTDNASRAQAAVVIYRLLDKVQ